MKKLIFCLLIFVMGNSVDCWAVKIRNKAVPVYIFVGGDNVVRVTRDSRQATDFAFGYMGEKPNKRMMFMLNDNSYRVLGWTPDHELFVRTLTTEISPDMFMWRHDAQTNVLCEYGDANPWYLSLDDGSDSYERVSLSVYFDDFARWIFEK